MPCIEDKSFKSLIYEETIKQYHICFNLLNNNNQTNHHNTNDMSPTSDNMPSRRRIINVDESGMIMIRMLDYRTSSSSTSSHHHRRLSRMHQHQQHMELKSWNSCLSLVASSSESYFAASLRPPPATQSSTSPSNRKSSRYSLAKTNSRHTLRPPLSRSPAVISPPFCLTHKIVVGIGFDIGLGADVTFECSVSSSTIVHDLVVKVLKRLNLLIDYFNKGTK